MGILGNFMLMVALGLAIFGTISAFLAAYLARERFRQAAVRSFWGVAFMVLGAMICLGILLQNDAFYVAYVYGHSNLALPSIFKFTAAWGGSQGSLLFWTLILCIYTCIMLARTKKVPKLMMSWAMVFVGMALVFFLLINNIVSNPFNVWMETFAGSDNGSVFLPRDGRGLNPQLQHWAMIIHPPLLYAGYIGFLFPFAMALGALITRMESRDWARLIRGWTLGAWLILTLGIVLGGAWAYMELGWGGYWAWDPVENASFMPWLLGTAYIHSIMAQENRGMFKLWNILLLISTYLMCMFGTFITRSGLISSVHAFAESNIGNYFLGYICITILLSIWVVLVRLDQMRPDSKLVSATSREVGFLFNNIVFIALCVLMLMGTIYPMITEAMHGTKVELRHGYYNRVELPLFLILLLLMAIGPVLTWKRTTNRQLKERFILPTVAMVVAGGIGFALNSLSWMANLSFAVISFLLVTIVHEFLEVGRRRAKRAGEGFIPAVIQVVRMNKRRYGGYIAHFGVLVIAIGITGSAFNQQDKKELGVGETMSLAGYDFQVARIWEERTDNYSTLKGEVNLIKDGNKLQSFYPEQRYYLASEMQASEVSIEITPARDFYVVLAGYGQGSSPEFPIGAFHVYVNPLVIWIWIGTIILFLGTIVSMIPDAVRESAARTVPETKGKGALA